MTRALDRATRLLLVSIFCLLAPVAHAGLERYQDVVVADGNPRSALSKQGVRVTYLGTNAYLLESRSATLLVDPYFSRMSLLRVALNLRALPKRDLIERYLPVRQIDAVIVTHGHIDHLLDAAEVMTLTGAKLIASPTSVRLVQSLGMNARPMHSCHRREIRAPSRRNGPKSLRSSMIVSSDACPLMALHTAFRHAP